MCVYDIAWLDEALLLRFSICAYVCIFMRMYMCVHVCVYMCMCICICIYVCTRVGSFFLFVLSSLSTICRCMPGISEHLHACVGGDWKWGLFSLFMDSACYWHGRLCFGGGRDREFVLYISLFLRVVCVCACIRAYTHINNLGTWCEPRCGMDTWRASRTKID